MRLDQYLVENNYLESRSKAKDAILEGWVKVNNRLITKPSFDVNDNDQITIIEQMKYVSRAGEKLEYALEQFHISVENKVICDIGSSTGGFTDCCLQKHAKKVYCIDVGTNQLVDKIRNDSRVVVRENTNARYLKKDEFDEPLDFICMDVSFISCTLILPVIANILKVNGEAVILIKPQFEVGSENLDKHGVVNNPKAVKEKLEEIFSLLEVIKLVKCNCIKSSVLGRTGNEEYLLHVRKTEE